jgi:diguanylate cyclase (GGDEF)-like protein
MIEQVRTLCSPGRQSRAASEDLVRCPHGRSQGVRPLDTRRDAAFADLVELAALALGCRFSAISVIDERWQWIKAEIGLDLRQIPLSHSLCRHVVTQNDLLIVRDSTKDARFAANPLVTGGPQLRFYAGVPIRTKDGEPIAVLAILDTKARPAGISEQQKKTLETLARQAAVQLESRHDLLKLNARLAKQRSLARELRLTSEHDALTGLPNRAMFNRVLGDALNKGKRSGTRTALILVDVDHFKQINDSLGHDAGDAMLCAFASRLRSVLRSEDLAARLGGDEFGIVLRGLKRSDSLERLAASIHQRLCAPIVHQGRIIDCRASIGIAVAPDHAEHLESLVKCSDLALAAAKEERGRAVIFDQELARSFHQVTRMTDLARGALARQEIVPYYQPKVDLRTGRLTGFEALARWRRDGRAKAHPGMFAQAFGSRQLAPVASEQMRTQVLDDVRRWLDAGLDFGHVALNSCPTDFSGNDFAERLLAAMHEREIEPHMIELEVTEGVFVGRGAPHVARALAMLSERGVRIALDDFGTGFASLSHLKQFPVDVIKIDRTFVAGIGKRADDAAIVRAVVGLGESLGIATVAEGIETVEQADYARAQGCTYGQGFLFCKALPASGVPAIIRSPFLPQTASKTVHFRSRIRYRDAKLSLVREHEPTRAGGRG